MSPNEVRHLVQFDLALRRLSPVLDGQEASEFQHSPAIGKFARRVHHRLTPVLHPRPTFVRHPVAVHDRHHISLVTSSFRARFASKDVAAAVRNHLAVLGDPHRKPAVGTIKRDRKV